MLPFQEKAGINALVHGEPERNDRVQYFAEQLTGYLGAGPHVSGRLTAGGLAAIDEVQHRVPGVTEDGDGLFGSCGDGRLAGRGARAMSRATVSVRTSSGESTPSGAVAGSDMVVPNPIRIVCRA
ncbi:hypothetical protein Srufu_061770 [Streptomyces libani subsp. rufus]|nr:hypothetical protein Srufu_061770 [Streptomyces libani subsp. rufus]